MVLFIGASQKGYFVEEICEKKELDFAYVSPNTRIEYQKSEILDHPGVDFMVFDVTQYLDPADTLAKEILTVQRCNNAKIIIFAPGYRLNSRILIELYNVGVRNYILGATLTDQKDQLKLCMNGYYETNGIEELEVISLKEQEEERKRVESYKLIGIAGSMSRIGTTTQALQIVKYLIYKGYKACYIEMNNTGYIADLMKYYQYDSYDENYGDLMAMGVHHFQRQDKISDILKLGYDYYIYDFGVYNSPNFNKLSFLEKDIQIICLGTKAQELRSTMEIIDSNFYEDTFYLYPLTPEGDQKDFQDTMQEKGERTFFPVYSPEAHELAVGNIEIFEKIIPVENESQEPKRKGLFNKLKGWGKK